MPQGDLRGQRWLGGSHGEGSIYVSAVDCATLRLISQWFFNFVLAKRGAVSLYGFGSVRSFFHIKGTILA